MFSVSYLFIYSKSPRCLLPILSCGYLALHSQNACVCGCLCVCVSRDKILHFKNTFIIVIIYVHEMVRANALSFVLQKDLWSVRCIQYYY